MRWPLAAVPTRGGSFERSGSGALGFALRVTPAAMAVGLLALLVAPSWFIDLRVYLLGARHALDPSLYSQQLPGAGCRSHTRRSQPW